MDIVSRGPGVVNRAGDASRVEASRPWRVPQRAESIDVDPKPMFRVGGTSAERAQTRVPSDRVLIQVGHGDRVGVP